MIQRFGDGHKWEGWTDANVTRLIELQLRGKTMSQIAAELGTTKNSVVGRVDRTRRKTQGVTLMQLRGCSCRWPLSDNPSSPQFRYCGAPKAGVGSYCEEHRLIATGRGTKAEQMATRQFAGLLA